MSSSVICKAVPLRLQNNAKETRLFWIHIQIYNPAWNRHITWRDYVALPPAIYNCTSLNILYLFVTYITVNIIYYLLLRISCNTPLLFVLLFFLFVVTLYCLYSIKKFKKKRSEVRIPKHGDMINFPTVQNDGEILYP